MPQAGKIDFGIGAGGIGAAMAQMVRAASGNADAVFHDLRRTFATKLTMAAIPLRSTYPAFLQARERLFGLLALDPQLASLITCTGPGNPFLIDGIAQALGHANVDTLLNVYFHGAQILLADTARDVNGEIHVDDGRLANMLNRDRTAIVRLRSRRVKDLEPADTGSLVRHYLAKTTSTGRKKTKHCALAGNGERAEQCEKNRLSFVVLDRLLCQRKLEGHSLEELASNAMDLEISAEHVDRVIANYRKIVCNTGFDDFEPNDSELLSLSPSHGDGVLRGQKEREAALHSIADLLRKNAMFAKNFRSMVHTWVECVDAGAPRIVCRDLDSLNCTLDVLTTLGATDQQLRFEAVGSLQTPLVTAVLQKLPATRVLTSGRFSSGPKKVRVVEVSVLVKQTAGSKIPDGRDFHRLLAVTAGILAESPEVP